MIINEIWTYNHHEPIFALELGDINRNGQIEIIATTKKGELLIFSLDGTLLLEELISDNHSLLHCKLFDVDQDGMNEIILGGMDGLLRVFKYTRSNKLKTIWEHQFTGSISGFFFEDINGSGQEEIISYSLDKTIRALNPIDGMMIWGQVFEDGIGDAISWRNVKDLNHKEIIACGNDGTLRSFNQINGDLQWFKRFPNKLRCLSSLISKQGQVIASGGDGKVLHFISAGDHEELNSLEFEDYIWKLHSFPNDNKENLLVSTYSFAYFDKSISVDDIKFTSKLACIGENLEIIWEINNVNVESMEICTNNNMINILTGTTKGEILIIDGVSGNLLTKVKKNSCANMVKFLFGQKLIFSCHDDGSLHCFMAKFL